MASGSGSSGSYVGSISGVKITSKNMGTEYYGSISGSSGISGLVQAKYGVSVGPIMQAKYGVMINPPHNIIKYGVTIGPGDSPVQPAYGVVVPGTDLFITFDQLEDNIATLKKSINSLRNSWENETKRNISTLDNSWVGPDCASYTSKLTNMDKKVTNTIAALELLCSTYEQARDMVKDNQKKTLSSIESIK